MRPKEQRIVETATASLSEKLRKLESVRIEEPRIISFCLNDIMTSDQDCSVWIKKAVERWKLPDHVAPYLYRFKLEDAAACDTLFSLYAKHRKNLGSSPKPHKENCASKSFYVGKVETISIRQRISEHLGDAGPTASALKLAHWLGIDSTGRKTPLKLYLYPLIGDTNGLVTTLEKSLRHIRRPMFGERSKPKPHKLNL